MDRINVIGTSGSGKSTFARELARTLKYPYIEMDQLYWKPHWTHPTDEEFFAKLSAAIAAPRWVLDGNYSRTQAIKWGAVDTVIWIDADFLTNLIQALRRALVRAWTQEEIWPDTENRESFRMSFFSSESIVWYAIKTHAKMRKRYQALMENPEFKSIRFVRLRSRVEIRRFLSTAAVKNSSGH